MRRIIWSAAALLLLALAARARAQVAFTSATGITPTQVQNVPVNGSLPVAAPQSSASQGFSLTGAFGNNPFPSAQPIYGQSTFPTPGQLPGTGYLQAFGYQPPPRQPPVYVRFWHWLFGG